MPEFTMNAEETMTQTAPSDEAFQEESEAQKLQKRMTKEQIESHLLQRTNADFEYAKEQRSPHELKVLEWRRIFNGEWKEETKSKFPKAMFHLKATWMVYRFLAALLRAYFEKQYLARLGAAHAKGMTPMAAEIATKVVRWHLKNSIKSYLLIEDAGLDTAVDGTCWVKGGWERKYDAEGNQTVNKPFLEVLMWDDVFPDPDATCYEELRYVIHEPERDVDYLREKGSLSEEQGGFNHVEEVISHAGKSNKDEWVRRTGTPRNKQRQVVRLREYWGNLQLIPDEMLKLMDKEGIDPNTLPKDVVVTTYEDKYLLRIEENTYGQIPFFNGRFLKSKGQYRKYIQGQSLIELVRELVREWNSNRNQRRQYAKRALAGRIIVGRTAGLDVKRYKKSEDGGIIYADDARQITTVKLPDVGPSFDRELQFLDNDFEEAIGVTKGVQGVQQKGDTTATEFAGVMSMAVERLGQMIQVFNLTLIEPMIKFLVSMIVKWETPQHVTQIIGADIVVPPLHTIFNHEMDVVIEAGVSMTTIEQQINQVQMALQVVSPLLGIVPQVGVPVVQALAKKLLTLLPLEDVEQVWEFATGAQQPGMGGQSSQAWPTPQTAQGQAGGIANRGTESAAGQPPARPPAPRPTMPGQVQGGMSNAAR